MKNSHDLSQLNWKLSGYWPFQWRIEKSMETGDSPIADVLQVSACVPGSVQKSLLEAGVIQDWNYGLNSRMCEWVENRQWVYETMLPDRWLNGSKIQLRCLGLDYSGWIYLNGKEIYSFTNAHIVHTIDLTAYLNVTNNKLAIIFDCSPRWLGQFGFTSKIHDFKPRFNYYWDWTSRLVQIGIWDDIYLDVIEGAEIDVVHVETDYSLANNVGSLKIKGKVYGGTGHTITIKLSQNAFIVFEKNFSGNDFVNCININNLAIEKWWPNGLGEQQLYSLHVGLVDEFDVETDKLELSIGFRNVTWEKCCGSQDQADTWLCNINGKRIFLQGVNWTPIRTNFADVTQDDYVKRLELYKKLGCNILRVWGGASVEKECFYNLCDKLGLLVWQEFPLTGSGVDNCPPEDDNTIQEMSKIVESFIVRRSYHASLIIWCGGNELINDQKNRPLDMNHALIAQMGSIVADRDSFRRFLPTSPSGPAIHGDKTNYGKGLHWDVHGPWRLDHVGSSFVDWKAYWDADDSQFRSEVGFPGPSSLSLIEKYCGDLQVMPGGLTNSLWRRQPWWIEWDAFEIENGRLPDDLTEYVIWGQQRQARAIKIAAATCKNRFPRCGGIILWMGHDAFPCIANTSIIDFEGEPKPSAIAVAEVFNDNNYFDH